MKKEYEDTSALMDAIEKKLSEIGIDRKVDEAIKNVSEKIGDILDQKIFTFYQKILIRNIAIKNAKKFLHYKKK